MRVEQMQREMVAFEPGFISQFPNYSRHKCTAQTMFAPGVKHGIKQIKVRMREGDRNFAGLRFVRRRNGAPSTVVSYRFLRLVLLAGISGRESGASGTRL